MAGVGSSMPPVDAVPGPRAIDLDFGHPCFDAAFHDGAAEGTEFTERELR